MQKLLLVNAIEIKWEVFLFSGKIVSSQPICVPFCGFHSWKLGTRKKKCNVGYYLRNCNQSEWKNARCNKLSNYINIISVFYDNYYSNSTLVFLLESCMTSVFMPHENLINTLNEELLLIFFSVKHFIMIYGRDFSIKKKHLLIKSINKCVRYGRAGICAKREGFVDHDTSGIPCAK